MMLWVIFGVMGLAAFAVILVTLLRSPRGGASRAEYDLEVFRAQLREVEREVERGVLNESEAESARLEIQRRMLAADSTRRAAAGRAASPGGRVVAAGIALAVPASALGLYVLLGSPDRAMLSMAERNPGQAQGQASAGRAGDGPELAEIDAMMERLRQRLAANPDDLQGWIMLGRSSMALGRYEDAVAAFDRALALDDGLGFIHAARGEALVNLADGRVSAEARAAFRKALRTDPQNPAGRFYLALARQQDGDAVGALDGLIAMLREGPGDAPWYDGVRQQAAALASSLGLDPQAELPPRPAAAGQDPAEAADELSARLAEDPKDFRAWIALAEARVALGDDAGAQEALRTGAEAFPGAPFVQQQFQEAAARLGLADDTASTGGPNAEDVQAAGEMTDEEREGMVRAMVTGLAERLQDRPDDVEGWRMLARSYAVLGRTEDSLAAYRHLAERQPQNAEAQLDLARALLNAGDPGAPPGPEAVAAFKRVLELDEQNPDALFYLGEAAARRGDSATASHFWQRLLSLLPASSREHEMVRARLEGLDEGQ